MPSQMFALVRRYERVLACFALACLHCQCRCCTRRGPDPYRATRYRNSWPDGKVPRSGATMRPSPVLSTRAAETRAKIMPTNAATRVRLLSPLLRVRCPQAARLIPEGSQPWIRRPLGYSFSKSPHEPRGQYQAIADATTALVALNPSRLTSSTRICEGIRSIRTDPLLKLSTTDNLHLRC